jgi:hypothetical protein
VAWALALCPAHLLTLPLLPSRSVLLKPL